MTEDLAKKLSTPCAFDTPWLKDQFQNWKPSEELKKAVFMEHMYNCDGRSDPEHPMHGLYTGLWQNFCVKEAGPVMRDRWFEMIEAIDQYLKGELQPIQAPVVIS
jgi:hypothetical protein